MANTEKCKTCKGSGEIEALVSQHGDEKETVKCPHCSGRGEIHYMTDEEERDYRENNDGDGWH